MGTYLLNHSEWLDVKPSTLYASKFVASFLFFYSRPDILRKIHKCPSIQHLLLNVYNFDERINKMTFFHFGYFNSFRFPCGVYFARIFVYVWLCILWMYWNSLDQTNVIAVTAISPTCIVSASRSSCSQTWTRSLRFSSRTVCKIDFSSWQIARVKLIACHHYKQFTNIVEPRWMNDENSVRCYK